MNWRSKSSLSWRIADLLLATAIAVSRATSRFAAATALAPEVTPLVRDMSILGSNVGRASAPAACGTWSATGSLVIEHVIEKSAGCLLLLVELKTAAFPLGFPHLFHKVPREVGLHQGLAVITLGTNECRT